MNVLQQIIIALTPTEKRYFKMFATAFKTESHLLKLFNALDKTDVATDSYIKQQTGIKNLTKARSDLRKLVFKAMRNYREDLSNVQQVRDALSDIDFLMRKGLNDEARKEAHKIWKLVLEEEIFHYTTEVYYRLCEIANITLESDGFAGPPNMYAANMQKISNQASEINIAFAYNLQLTTFLRSEDYDPNKGSSNYINNTARQIQGHLEHFTSPYAQLIFLSALAICHQANDELKEAAKVYEQISDIFAQYPQLIKINPKIYVGSLINYGVIASGSPLMAQKARKLFKETEDFFITHAGLFKAFPDKISYYRQRLTTNKIYYIKNNLDWRMLPSLEKEVLLHIKNVQEKEKVVTALQAAGLASIFYKQKNYAKALEWINIYYGLEDAKVMPPLMLCIKLLEVLSLYGLGQLDLADTKATNLYKVYFRNKLNDEFYKLLGTVLRKLNHWHKNNKTDAIEISRLKTLFAKLKDNPNYVMYAQFVEPEEILDLVK